MRFPFSVLEQGVHLLDHPAEPWSVHLEVRFEARLDPERLREAIRVACTSHPMTLIRKAGGKPGGRLMWERMAQAEVEPFDVVTCPDDRQLKAARDEVESQYLSLENAPPFRARLASYLDADHLILNMNHAAGDGLGALRFLRSVGARYAERAEDQPEIDAIASRMIPKYPRRVSSGELRAGLRELVEALLPASHLAPDEPSGRAGYGLHLASIDSGQTAKLLSGRRQGVSVNDLLLAALHISVERWNAEHGRKTARVGIMMPVNMRPKDWWYEVVGNFSLMVIVATRKSDRRSLTRTTQAVARRTRTIKDEQRPAAALKVLALLDSLPLRAKRVVVAFLSRPRLIQTSLLTNLGAVEPLDFGADLKSSAMWMSAPARMPLGLSVGAVTQGRRLHLTFRYRHSLFSPEAAAAFARVYLGVLDDLVHVP